MTKITDSLSLHQQLATVSSQTTQISHNLAAATQQSDTNVDKQIFEWIALKRLSYSSRILSLANDHQKGGYQNQILKLFICKLKISERQLDRKEVPDVISFGSRYDLEPCSAVPCVQ